MANLYGYNSSSAHKLDYNYNQNRDAEEKKLHSKESNPKPQRVEKRNPAKNLAAFLKVAICFAVAFAIVNGYVKINEASSEVSRLDEENNRIEAKNQDLRMKIDKAFDPEQLQMVAIEKYGMVRPEQHQTFYVDMEQEDFAETPDAKNETAEQTTVKGVTGSMTGTLNIFN